MSTLERIEQIEKDLAEVKSILLDPNNPLLQLVAQRTASTEQSMVTLGKTLSALTDELISNGTVSSDAVMNRLRDAQDRDYHTQIKSMKDSGMLASAEVVSEDSVVVITQHVVDTSTGEMTTVSNYRLVPMGNPMVNPALRDNLLGKLVGGTIDGSVSDVKKEIITIKEIYNLADKEVSGENTEEGVSFEDATVQEN